MTLLHKIRSRSIRARADKLRPGERTSAEWAKLWGVNPRTADRTLNEGVRIGVVGRRVVRMPVGAGVILRPVAVYREKPRKR